MVRLTRIYTRGGDKGKTSLGDGRRVDKHGLRVDAYGTVEEANAVIGLARLHSGGDAEADAMLARIQNDLFDLGADLCLPESPETAGRLRVSQDQIDRLEREIDRMNADLAALDSFILPGGRPGAAYLHLARTVVRRAERQICHLAEVETVNPLAVAYANRLSDHLFVIARRLNDNGGSDVLWVPGGSR
ncbi:MAG TPA: cob(I)yrinic acid a,c-diamide adenosyltransferase [Rhodospirillaceae bacterium]|nr:cob(I)yrinic acid a,c-diamide adenosyltransferase [Rhodospirillaceae bacterium]